MTSQLLNVERLRWRVDLIRCGLRWRGSDTVFLMHSEEVVPIKHWD